MEKILLKEVEKHAVMLIEKRGVAGHPWKYEIDKIMRYIYKYVVNQSELCDTHKKISFKIPYELANQFSFLGDLEIYAEAIYDKNGNAFGSGSLSNSSNVIFSKDLQKILDSYEVIFEKDKLYHKVINICCTYDDNHKVRLSTAQGRLYHEINHAYHQYIDIKQNGNWNGFNISVNKGKMPVELNNEDVKKIIRIIVYRLFSETEYNAMVASVYGELRGMNSDFINYQTDYKKTQAYAIYNIIKNTYIKIIDSLNFDEYLRLRTSFEKYNINVPALRGTIPQFKNGMKKKITYLLQKLIDDICRIASLWYEDSYEERIRNNNQPMDTIPEDSFGGEVYEIELD